MLQGVTYSSEAFPSAVSPAGLGPELRSDSTRSFLGPCILLAWDTSVSVLVFW